MDVEKVDGKLDFRCFGYLNGRSPQFGGPRGVQDLAARGVGDHSVDVSTGIGDGRYRYNGTSVCTVCGGACSTASDIALRCSRTPGRFLVRNDT